MDGSSEFYVMSSTVDGVYASSMQNPADWFLDWSAGGVRSDSGMAVNARTAMTYSAVYSAVAQISGDVSRVSLDVFKRTSADDRERQLQHDAYRLLNLRPNNLQTAFTLRQTLTLSALLRGNGYALIVRQLNGRPQALLPLRSDMTRPEVQEDGTLLYLTKLDGQTEQPLLSSDVLHVKGLGDGIEGYSMISNARNSMGLGLAAEKHGNSTFKNGATPTLAFDHPGRLSHEKAEELQRRIMARSSGTDNAGKPIITSGGMKVTPLSMSNEDAQWLETRKFQRVEIASWFQIPPSKIGDAVKNYNSVEAEERTYLTQTLSRWFAAWESECRVKLLTPQEQARGDYIEHNSKTLIQGDWATQASVITQLRGAMIITQNEARRSFNLNGVPDGDTFENPNTSVTPSAQLDTNSGEQPSRKTLEAHHDLIRTRVEHLVRTEVGTLKRLSGSNSPVAAMTNFYAKFQEKIAGALQPCITAVESLPGIAKLPTAEVIAAAHVEESQQAIRSALTACPYGMERQAIEDTVYSWTDDRPSYIADSIMKGFPNE